MKSVRLLGILACLAAVTAAAQSVPTCINYQGRLIDGDGEPLATGDYVLKFSIYDEAEEGIMVWGEQIFDGQADDGHGAKVPVVHGHFNVILGPVDSQAEPRPIEDAFSGPDRWLQVRIGDDGGYLRDVNRPPSILVMAGLRRTTSDRAFGRKLLKRGGGCPVLTGTLLARGLRSRIVSTGGLRGLKKVFQ